MSNNRTKEEKKDNNVLTSENKVQPQNKIEEKQNLTEHGEETNRPRIPEDKIEMTRSKKPNQTRSLWEQCNGKPSVPITRKARKLSRMPYKLKTKTLLHLCTVAFST